MKKITKSNKTKSNKRKGGEVDMRKMIGVLVVMGKIRVNETGILEGTGPAADRVREIYQRYINEMES